MNYVPERGDVVWLHFELSLSPEDTAKEPKVSESKGRRPAFVLSPAAYNEKTGLALLCPLVTTVQGHAFEVEVPADCNAHGVILADQVKNLDWRARNATFLCRLPDEIITEVGTKARALLD